MSLAKVKELVVVVTSLFSGNTCDGGTLTKQFYKFNGSYTYALSPLHIQVKVCR